MSNTIFFRFSFYNRLFIFYFYITVVYLSTCCLVFVIDWLSEDDIYRADHCWMFQCLVSLSEIYFVLTFDKLHNMCESVTINLNFPLFFRLFSVFCISSLVISAFITCCSTSCLSCLTNIVLFIFRFVRKWRGFQTSNSFIPLLTLLVLLMYIVLLN